MEIVFQLLELVRFQQILSFAGHLFGRIDLFTLAFAGVLHGSIRLMAFRRRLRNDPPARLVCPKRDADSEFDDYLREIWTLEQPVKLWYLARHNRNGNYISLIGCNMDSIYSDRDELSGEIDFRPLATFETISSKINQSGVGAADLRPNECGPVWHRLFDRSGFARLWIVQIDLPNATGEHDHRGYLVFGWSKDQVGTADHTTHQLITNSDDGPLLNLNTDIYNTAQKAGLRAAEILERYHYQKSFRDRLQEAGENFLISGKLLRA